MGRSITLWPVVVVALLAPCAAVAQMRPRPYPPLEAREPMPEGQRLTAADGDTVVVEGDARVRIIHRRPVFARLVADAGRRAAVAIVEHVGAAGDTPTRRANKGYAFSDLEGQWPLPQRWEGAAWIEEQKFSDDERMMGGVLELVVETPGVTLRFARGPQRAAPTPSAATLFYRGMSVGRMPNVPFDEAERQQLNALAGGTRQVIVGNSSVGGSTTSVGSWTSSSSGTTVTASPSAAPMRNGNVGGPHLLRRVDPMLPKEARDAGVQGIVILEITVGVDGTVGNARVLRSIPLLDQAALDAVRQWRYEPKMLNGRAVPVILTVTVPFMP